MQPSTPPSPGPPQIGVLCIDVARSLLDDAQLGEVRSYIALSYVQFLEDAGANVVPIWLGRNDEYYEKLLSKLNGVFIPGGAVFLEAPPNGVLTNECVRSAGLILKIAATKNTNGVYFPVWGTCLGMQLLFYHDAVGENRPEVRSRCEDMDCSLPISFVGEFRDSKLFAKLDEEMANVLESEPFGYHFHKYCITQEGLNRFQLTGNWRVLAVNRDSKQCEFATFVEHKRYPFYGCQVHLERVAHEIHDGKDNCGHTAVCRKAAQYFADFFVAECKKCTNRFESKSECDRHAIRNFKAAATDHVTRWQKCFLFYANSEYPAAATVD